MIVGVVYWLGGLLECFECLPLDCESFENYLSIHIAIGSNGKFRQASVVVESKQ
jgi:hypothetical protein